MIAKTNNRSCFFEIGISFHQRTNTILAGWAQAFRSIWACSGSTVFCPKPPRFRALKPLLLDPLGYRTGPDQEHWFSSSVKAHFNLSCSASGTWLAFFFLAQHSHLFRNGSTGCKFRLWNICFLTGRNEAGIAMTNEGAITGLGGIFRFDQCRIASPFFVCSMIIGNKD